MFKRIDTDFHHLFNAWFNRGFLVMEPLDWTTPAHILEKIIAYEAVHEIESWSELRRRLEPADRYCYGFFHPSMGDDPLVFVEVALTDHIPSSIGEILQREEAMTGSTYVDRILTSYFGPFGPGAASALQFGLDWLGPEEITPWATRHFTADNAALVIIGEPPDSWGIELPVGEPG